MRVVLLRRQAIVDAWFAATLKTYPEATARSLASSRDPFRNPAGHLLRENLARLFDAAVAGDDEEMASRALGELVRLRAVQDFDADGAVGFIEPLKEIVRTAAGQDLDDRIDRLARLASDLYRHEVARIGEIGAREASRRTWMTGRLYPKPEA